MSLGKVVRNALDTKSEAPKPHLRDRLGCVQYRADGAVTTDNQGRLAFAPAYGKSPVALPNPYKEPAYVPFQGEHAYLDPNPKARYTAAPGSTGATLDPKPKPKTEFKPGDKVRLECTVKDLMGVGVYRECAEKIVAGAVGDLLYVGENTSAARFPDAGGQWHLNTKFLRRADAPAPDKPATPSWDPMTEPLREGDVVEIVFQYSRGYTGRKGRVVGFDHIGDPMVDFGDGMGPHAHWSCRDSLKLIERPNT